MMAAIEIDTITFRRCEEAYRRAEEMKRAHRYAYAERGMRAVRSKDPRVLKVLERCAELMDKEREKQIGETQRATHTVFADRAHPTSVQLWREAYRCAVDGIEGPQQHFAWVYGCAADLAGYW